jgi:small subunit ribosomal protein S6
VLCPGSAPIIILALLLQGRRDQEEVNPLTRAYEVIYILNPTIGEEAIQTTQDRIQNLIESNATIKNVDVWGRRRLAYEINDQPEGYYILTDFDAEPEFPRELERVLKITEGVLRFLVVRVDD